MEKATVDLKLVQRICRGDQQAMEFLGRWTSYAHAIDDIVDGETRGQKDLILTFARAIELYSHPFYLRNIEALRQVARNVTLMYLQTVEWEKAEGWKAQWSDLHRHCSIEMVTAVAIICGGVEHAAAVIPELRITAYHDHHDREGRPK